MVSNTIPFWPLLICHCCSFVCIVLADVPLGSLARFNPYHLDCSCSSIIGFRNKNWGEHAHVGVYNWSVIILSIAMWLLIAEVYCNMCDSGVPIFYLSFHIDIHGCCFYFLIGNNSISMNVKVQEGWTILLWIKVAPI